MTNYSLRARMMILILAPTVLIGLLLSIFFVAHRYNDLQRQLEDAGASIIEPLAVSSEYGMICKTASQSGSSSACCTAATPILCAPFPSTTRTTGCLSPLTFSSIPANFSCQKGTLSPPPERGAPRRFDDFCVPYYLGKLFTG